MDINKKIGARINELLAKQNKKQKELSAFLGIKDNVVSYFVHGKRIPNIEQLIKIADFFDTTVDYLVGHSNAASSDIDIQTISKNYGFTEDTLSGMTIRKNNTNFINTVNFLFSLEKKENAGMQILSRISDFFNTEIEEGIMYEVKDGDIVRRTKFKKHDFKDNKIRPFSLRLIVHSFMLNEIEMELRDAKISYLSKKLGGETDVNNPQEGE